MFDSSLKMQNKFWGVRDLGEVSDEDKKCSFLKDELIRIPANNFLVIYRKEYLWN